MSKFKVTTISVSDLHEFPGNPNEQDANTFSNLVSEIDEDEFDEPLIVVPRENFEAGADGYVVVSGNHRLKAAKVLNMEELPCRVKDWDEEKSKIKVVRRNMLRGDHDPRKFTKLIDSFGHEYTPEQLSDAMGFQDIDEFSRLYQRESESAVKKAAKDVKAPQEENLIDGMTMILNRLFSEYGDTVPYSFMFFLYGTKIHTVVQANNKLKMAIEKITRQCVADGLDINVALTGLLKIGMQQTNFEHGPPERQMIEDAAKDADDEEDYELQGT